MPRKTVLRIIIGLAVIAVIAVAALWALLQSLRRDEIPSGTPSGELAFLSNRGGQWDIWVIDASGALRVLTEDDSPDYFASWDFASERVNFISPRGGELGPAQVYPDGSNLRALSVMEAVTTLFFEGRIDWDPSWSPDASRVVWSSLRDLNLELYVADTAPDSQPVRLTNSPARDWFAAWSPDGTRIAFASDRAGSEDVHVMNADGSGVRALTDDPANDIFPVWSLDGETILFVSERVNLLQSGQLDLYTLDPDADRPQAIPFDPETIFSGDPTTSADGREVAFMSNRDGDWDIYLMDADGSNVRRVTDSQGDDLFPVWRPAPKN